MGKVYDITLQIQVDDETVNEVEDKIEELISEEIWQLNFIYANHVDTIDNVEDSDNRPG